MGLKLNDLNAGPLADFSIFLIILFFEIIYNLVDLILLSLINFAINLHSELNCLFFLESYLINSNFMFPLFIKFHSTFSIFYFIFIAQR